MAQRASILIIYTGGTIGMKTDEHSGALVPFDFSSIYEEFPSLKRLNIDISVHTMERVIDSSNVSAQGWCDMAEVIRANYQLYDGFVVLHGTDTMSYSASALSFMFQNLSKPVIFTGSQIPIGVLRTDGRENLITAIEIAGAYHRGVARVPEVALYFQNRLLRGNRSTKWSAEELNAFHSPNYPALADVGVNINYHSELIRQAESSGGELEVISSMCEDVVIIKLFPGLSCSMLDRMLTTEGLRGVVLETYGAGNAPTEARFIEVIEHAVARGVIILNTTQCVNGKVEMSIYETGQRLQKAGVLCGYDMTSEAAVTKLSYVLGNFTQREEIINRLNSQIRGEFSV